VRAAAFVLLALFSLPAAAAPPAKAAAPTLHFAPKARKLSTYTSEIRFEITTRAVTFDAPPAYQKSFDFWAGRMRGQKKSELIQLVLATQDREADGTVPFRRTAPRYQVEYETRGESAAPYSTIEKDVKSQVWEGQLDPLGNVTAIRLTAGKDNPDFTNLSLPMIERCFPTIDGPRDLKVGDSFTEIAKVRSPAPLNISGLQEVGLQITRAYVLKEISGDGRLATFVIKASYAADPGTPSKAPDTTLVIGGGGVGEAVFEIGKGVFLSSRLPTVMTMDVSAPLRPLPDAPETAKAGTGKTHIDLELLLSAQQAVQRTWGEEEEN
jgi:hypothetical protein